MPDSYRRRNAGSRATAISRLGSKDSPGTSSLTQKPTVSPSDKEFWSVKSGATERRCYRGQYQWVTGTTLRKILDISPVTLWRWRHMNGFPAAKSINGRLYFPWREIEAWLMAQPDAA
jgi:hypothetical protein